MQRAIGYGAAVAVISVLAASCSSNINVDLVLLEPCTGEAVLTKDNQCQFMEVWVSSLNLNDPLHPSQAANGLGPRKSTCSFADRGCSINGEDLLGPSRIIDVRCRTTADGPVMARATSQAMTLGGGGIEDSLKLALLAGNVNSFTETTVLDINSQQVGQCSQLGVGQQGRYGHTATTLRDGRVLITGGIVPIGGTPNVLATAEIFDPSTGHHQVLVDSSGNAVTMQAPSGRAFHTATLLRDGRVLLAGGVGLVAGKLSTLQSAELFNPATNRFESVSVMGSGRAHHTATMLADGNVLVVGGATYDAGNITGYYDTALLYHADTNSWEELASRMSAPRAFHAAVALDSVSFGGNVVVFGGENQDGTLNTFELFTLSNRQFNFDAGNTMSKNRSHLCAAGLPNSQGQVVKVMIAGGKTVADDDSSVDTGIEIFDPTLNNGKGGFETVELNLNVGRMDHTCTTLENGDVLIAGGREANGLGVNLGELLVIDTGGYRVEQLTDFLQPPRYHHRATVLQSGWVLLTGGLPDSQQGSEPVTQSVLFVPEPAF